jgi:site-specific DNA recombinase
VQTQLDFLRKFCDLYGLPIVGDYIDDGISGTVAFDRRPDGQRLLTDAKAKGFQSVVFYKLSRLGRKLGVILDAYNELTDLGITIRSATVSLDTSTANGRFVFQILGAVAELDRETISQNTTLGRNRVAGYGQYIGGPIPLGYDVDRANRFIESTRIVPELAMTEAVMVRDLFLRLATGETSLNRECARLTALGIPRVQRYGVNRRKNPEATEGVTIERSTGWGLSSLGAVIRNPFYKGQCIVKSRYGQIDRPVPALVDIETWEQAQATLKRNRSLSKKNSKNVYLLRGLVHCENCGLSYVGMTSGGAQSIRKYRCNSNAGRSASRPDGRCDSKILPADWHEDEVWERCREFILNPGAAIDEARKRLRDRLTTSAGFDTRRQSTLALLAEKETERERVLTLYRRGKISGEDAEHELDAVAREAGQLREELESMRAQAALIDAEETYITDSIAMLTVAREQLAEIDETNDQRRKRAFIERYVSGVTVYSERVGTRRLQADIKIKKKLQPEPIAVEDIRRSRVGNNCTLSNPSAK